MTEHTEAVATTTPRRGSWLIGLTSLGFVLLQSACAAVMAISGLRLVIGLSSLAFSIVPGFIFAVHIDAIRIPMLIVAIFGSAINLYVIWRIRSLRSRPSSRWRVQPVTPKQCRAETIQIVLAVLTLVLVIVECVLHHILHGGF